MAITLTQEPQLYTPAYNDIVFIADSTNSAQVNFRFKVEIYRDAGLGLGMIIATQFYNTRPDESFAIIDVHRIVESTVQQSLIEDQVLPSFGKQAHGNVVSSPVTNQELNRISVVITEQFGIPRADDDVSTTKLFIFNSALTYFDFTNFIHTNFLPVNNSTDPRFLTNAPSDQPIRLVDTAQLSWLQTDDDLNPDIVDVIQIKTFTVADVLLKTFTITAGAVDSLGADFTNFYRSVLVGPDDLENTIFATGIKPVFGVTTAYYTVQLLDANTDPSSELRRFTLVECETRFVKRRVQFLNRLSGLDAFTFDLVSRKSLNAERKQFERTGYLFDTPLTNLQKESGRINYTINSRERFILNSDWIDEETAIFLAELFTASEIFLKLDNDLHAVTISDTDYQIRTEVVDKLFNFTIRIDFTYQSISQRA